jgi:hypothetical protein
MRSACVGAREFGLAHARACIVLLIQLETRMRHTVTSFLISLTPPNFSTVSHKRREFRKEVIEYKMCILVFSTTFV